MDGQSKPNIQNSDLANTWVRDIRTLVMDPEFRDEFQKWLAPSPVSIWVKFTSNTLFQIIFSFILTGLIGTLLTNHFTYKLKEIDRAKNFQDKLNDARVYKIMEVWEKTCALEKLADDYTQELIEINRHDSADPLNKNMIKLQSDYNSMMSETLLITQKNRIWLGEKSYNRVIGYINETTMIIIEHKGFRDQRSRPSIPEIRDLILSEQ